MKILLLSRAVVATLIPIGVALSPSIAAMPGSPDKGDLHYADVVKAAMNFDEVIVWEGLPHPFERASRASEMLTKENFRIDDQAFYSKPLPFKREETAAISDAVLKQIQNFKPWSGLKFCGGFHADYAVEWRYKGATLAQALFCFSCHEAQFRVGERVEQVDQSDEGFKQFRALLSSHRQQRPAFQTDSDPAKTPVLPVDKPIVPKPEVMAPQPLPAPPPPKIDLDAPPSRPPPQKPQ